MIKDAPRISRREATNDRIGCRQIIYREMQNLMGSIDLPCPPEPSIKRAVRSQGINEIFLDVSLPINDFSRDARRRFHDHPPVGTLVCHLDAHFCHQCSATLGGEIAIGGIGIDF